VPSQSNISDNFPAFLNYPLIGMDGSRNTPYPYDPWFMAYAWPNVAALIALWGQWPGDPRWRPIWPHYAQFVGPYWLISVLDPLVGDHIVLNESVFRASFGLLIMRNDTLGVFTPYL
jgi:hypothetical protein